ncbi:G2-specific protein kinase nimA, partial [Pseudocercospora fuligena]
MAVPQYVLVEPRDQERYVDFELEARRDPETNYQAWEPEFEASERSKFRTRWLKHSPEARTKSAEALDYYLDGKKDVADAERDVEVASRYRGAPDDEGDEIGGRPRFEYFEERQKVLAQMLDALTVNIRNLSAFRVGKVNDTGFEYCTILMDRNKEKIERQKKVLEVDIPALRKQAKKKLQILGKRKRADDDDVEMPPDWDIDKVYESYRVAPANVDFDSGWCGSWPLGGGGYGEACLWVQLNDDGKVENRVVVKESMNSNYWFNPDNWTGGSHEEAGILTDPYSTNMGQAARALNWVDDVSSQCTMLPEAFCWHALETFALAGLLMQRGKLSQKGNLLWEEIIHRDIKPENIFIGVPSTSRYPGYPELKLGDFGLAFVEREWDKRRPRQIGVGGTPQHQAPEQLLLLRTYGGLLNLWPQTKPMTAKTNVWAFGMILWGMIQGKAAPEDEQHDLRQEGTKESPQFDATAQSFYSSDLLDLVRACTRFHDEDRPSFDAIMKKVLEHTTRGPNERASELRDLKRGQLNFNAHYGPGGQNEFVPVVNDDYRIGCSLVELPPLRSGLMRQVMPAEMKDVRSGWRRRR